MDLHPDIPTAAAHVRTMYDLGVTYSIAPVPIGTTVPRRRTVLGSKVSGRMFSSPPRA